MPSQYKAIVPKDTPPYNNYPLYHTSDGAHFGGYDFMSSQDVCFGFDFNSTGWSDHIVAYRPGGKKLSILARVRI